MTWAWTTVNPTIFKEYSTSERDALGDPPDNIIIYNTTTAKLQFYNGHTGAWNSIATYSGTSSDTLRYMIYDDTETTWEASVIDPATTSTDGGIKLANSAITATGTSIDSALLPGVTSNQIQRSLWTYIDDTASDDDYLVAYIPTVAALFAGLKLQFRAQTANTGACTLKVDSTDVKNIKKHEDQALADGDIRAGQIVTVIYDGTNFQMQSQLGNAPSGSGDDLGDHTATQDIEMGGNNIQTVGVITLKEQTAADADVATEGQLWVNTDTPNTLAFTDDAGNDHELSGIRFITIRIIDADTDVTTGTSVGGDWVCPFTGFILQDDDYKGYCSANNDTFGVTGTQIVDVNKEGTSIFTTNLLDITGASVTSTADSATQPDLSTNPLSITAGDKITIDIDQIHSGTAAKGLSVTLAIRQTPQI